MPVVRKNLKQSSMLRKFLCYRETWRQGLHRTRFGIGNFRVLVVTASDKRANHLVAACKDLSGGSLFMFANQEQLSSRNIYTASD
jgi:hypothetical protein